MPPEAKPLEIDGRTGEGGGQLVRNCIALSSVLGVPVRIENVRGNRAGGRGGGLKAQHLAGIEFLHTATAGDAKGLEIGSKTLEFRPQLTPTSFTSREVNIEATTSAASCTLIFQAVFPFLLFAANDNNEPIILKIHGGTNVSWSPSVEFLITVLLPTLEQCFGIRAEGELVSRGWNQGPLNKGCIKLKIHPVPRGEKLTLRRQLEVPQDWNGDPDEVDVYLISPSHLHSGLQNYTVDNLSVCFPSAKVNFVLVEESQHDARNYVLLVAKKNTESGILRWGRDMLGLGPGGGKKAKDGQKDYNKMAAQISARVCGDLRKEVERRGAIDEFLQDQVVIFQALAEGTSAFLRPDEYTAGEGGEEAEAGTGTECEKKATNKQDGRQKHAEEPSACLSLDSLEDALPTATGVNAREGLGCATTNHGPKQVKDKERVYPFGNGSQHTRTSRWISSLLLPRTQWFDQGQVVQGIGVHFN